MPTLLNNEAATGSAVQWDGGRGVFSLAGTVGGATITLQYLGPDATTYLTAATALTAVGLVAFELPPGRIRALVAGGSPSGLYARADQSKG
ncbi:MAG: hypothetical protein RLZZ373_2679 [Pseudomonadota bacterium]|jgi:hypothetical protein